MPLYMASAMTDMDGRLCRYIWHRLSHMDGAITSVIAHRRVRLTAVTRSGVLSWGGGGGGCTAMASIWSEKVSQL